MLTATLFVASQTENEPVLTHRQGPPAAGTSLQENCTRQEKDGVIDTRIRTDQTCNNYAGWTR